MSAVSVESFECHETAHEPIEISEEAARIISELELDGQDAYLVKDKGKTKQRCPYRQMTAEEEGVYRELCPDIIALKSYDRSPIPLRVLQIAAHAKIVIPGLKMFVWDKAKAEVKDPVLVGQVGENTWDRDFKRFILARWGSELDTFATLAGAAAKSKRARLLSDAESRAAEIRNMTDAQIILER